MTDRHRQTDASDLISDRCYVIATDRQLHHNAPDRRTDGHCSLPINALRRADVWGNAGYHSSF